MKRNNLILVTAFMLAWTPSPSIAASNPLEKQILKLQPQADKDGDGKLSKVEEAALNKKIMKRFPRADADGDGVLSAKEMQAVMRQAAARAKRQGGQKPTATKDDVEGGQAPTHANVKYGDHERNVFDIWLADSPRPTPLAIYIHGGGLRAGSKEKLNPAERDQLLEAGISVAAINYRYLSTATPKPTPYSDARRALQLMRSKAREWNLDKDKVAAFGGSAGAQICMWLAFSDDMAKPDSKDPIERESTRLTCVATSGGQTATSAEFWLKTIGPLLGDKQKIESLARPFGGESDPEKARIAMWGAKTLEEANEIASRHTALSIVSPDDPPIFMSYSMSPTAKLPTDPKRIRGWLIHHVNLGIALKEKSDALKHEAHLNYPGADIEYQSQVEFFVDKLLKKERR
jgi:acetyl esterase